MLAGCMNISPKSINRSAEPGKVKDQGFLVPAGPTQQKEAITSTASFTPEATISKSILFTLAGRVGFGLSSQADAGYWARQLGASWYLDWQVKDGPPDKNLPHWQMVRFSPKAEGWESRPSIERIRQIAHQYPGQVWILGNEPDVIWQDNLPAEVYAQAYHEVYQAIKAADPTAWVAPAAISQATDIRLAYLDRVITAYQSRYGGSIPVDGWTVHGFVLREERGSWGVDIPPGFDYDIGESYSVADTGRIDLFQKQILAFRKWMASNGYQDRPLALTEFGVLMPDTQGFTSEFRAQYLQAAFRWLASATDPQIGDPEDGNRLVQYWSWFSLSDALYPASDLVNIKGNRLTMLGTAFREFMDNTK